MAIRVTSDVLRGREVAGVFRREKVAAAPGGRFLGLVLLFSTHTGELLAILPDGIIQRLRVGASSALAADRLARANAATVGLVGAGNQAAAQLRGLACVRRISNVRVFSPTAARREAFAAAMSAELELPVQAVNSAEESVRDSDLVVAATNSGRPVLEAGWLCPGMHVSFIREFEADDATLERADLLVVHTKQGEIDHYTPRGSESLADLQRGRGYPWQRCPDLSELLSGLSRTSDQQITMFMNNFGVGIQFAALGARAYEGARARGLGRELPDDWFLEAIQP